MTSTANDPNEKPKSPRRSRAMDANAHFAFKKELAAKIRAAEPKIREWYERHAEAARPPIYCSVDLRDAGYKIAPVDSNLYPAGFNNVCPEDQRTAPGIFRQQIERRLGAGAKKILILPELNTTNVYYLENLYYLQEIVRNAGFEVRIGWFSEEKVEGPLKLKTQSEKELEAWWIDIRDGQVDAGGFVPDLILANNDFSGGYPKRLDGLKTPVLPSHKLGWHSRKKSTHFIHYNRLVKEFCAITGIDPWVLSIDTVEVDGVNFNEDVGIDRVIAAADGVLKGMKVEFEKHQLKKDPFVFVKNNAGTYGMGIMVVHMIEELQTMNRRTKNKMSVGKNKRSIDSIVVQEGIPTATLVDRLAAEPVIYLFGCELIGGFLRTNTERGTEENLNSQGMVFRKLCMTDLREEAEEGAAPKDGDEPLLEMVYGSVARISALATGYELKEKEA